jgi:hypothetical protein
VAACAGQPAASAPGASSAARVATGETPSSCHARGSGLFVLPDPVCTPGATNPAAAQATLASTVCPRGWTATVRPPESYTQRLKRGQMRAYGWSLPPSGYEEDHLIPLELGGAPSDPRNLWPEPGESNNPKDKVENAAHSSVCAGRMQLIDAQRAIAADWITFGRQLGAVA